jgi:hypothetical protein
MFSTQRAENRPILPVTEPHTIQVSQLATADTDIHCSFEPQQGGTELIRWLVSDISMPMLFRPLQKLIIMSFDDENVRTMAAVKQCAKAHSAGNR